MPAAPRPATLRGVRPRFPLWRILDDRKLHRPRDGGKATCIDMYDSGNGLPAGMERHGKPFNKLAPCRQATVKAIDRVLDRLGLTISWSTDEQEDPGRSWDS